MVCFKWSRISFFHSTFIYILYIRVSISGFLCKILFWHQNQFIWLQKIETLQETERAELFKLPSCHRFLSRSSLFFHEDWNNIRVQSFFLEIFCYPHRTLPITKMSQGTICVSWKDHAWTLFVVLLYNFFLFRILQLISRSSYWFSAPMQNTFCYCIFQHIFNFQFNFESALVYLNNSSCFFFQPTA